MLNKRHIEMMDMIYRSLGDDLKVSLPPAQIFPGEDVQRDLRELGQRGYVELHEDIEGNKHVVTGIGGTLKGRSFVHGTLSKEEMHQMEQVFDRLRKEYAQDPAVQKLTQEAQRSLQAGKAATPGFFRKLGTDLEAVGIHIGNWIDEYGVAHLFGL